jgi:hypothetical protein
LTTFPPLLPKLEPMLPPHRCRCQGEQPNHEEGPSDFTATVAKEIKARTPPEDAHAIAQDQRRETTIASSCRCPPPTKVSPDVFP